MTRQTDKDFVPNPFHMSTVAGKQLWAIYCKEAKREREARQRAWAQRAKKTPR